MSDKDLSKKIIKLDPLAERLDNVGMTGGLVKNLNLKNFLKKQKMLKETTKANLKYSKEVSKIGKEEILEPYERSVAKIKNTS